MPIHKTTDTAKISAAQNTYDQHIMRQLSKKSASSYVDHKKAIQHTASKHGVAICQHICKHQNAK